MKISSQLAYDLKFLSTKLEWGDVDKEEVKRCLKADPVFFSHFLSTWAAAVRAGYRYQEKGRYVRMAEFCHMNGLPDPYMHQHTDSEVDK